MARNDRLRLNSAKTELIWLVSSRSGVTIQPSTQVRALGIIVDSDLSFTAHVSHVASVCFASVAYNHAATFEITGDATLVYWSTPAAFLRPYARNGFARRYFEFIF